ncbi:MAG: hypothetical protein MZV63_48380 [Marinilabiliales bacterium]|nr:hypothetical protein [Marinilabiliales bacterium]
MELIKQEVSAERYIDIPEEVLDLYRTYRPSPLFRARTLKRPWEQRAGSITSMREEIIQVPTRPILPSRRHITTRWRASGG